jgi:hypothetical protein
VRRDGRVERAVGKRPRDVAEVRADLREALGIGRVLARHDNRPAVLPQQEMMFGLVLIEAHGQGAALLERFVLPQLAKMFFVRHAGWHGGVLSGRQGAAREEHDPESEVKCGHVSMLGVGVGSRVKRHRRRRRHRLALHCQGQ